MVSPDDDWWVEDLSARSARPSGVECLVRRERGPRDQRLYRFQEDMGREKLLKLMNECRENADKEPFYTETGAPSAASVEPPTSLAGYRRWRDIARI